MSSDDFEESHRYAPESVVTFVGGGFATVRVEQFAIYQPHQHRSPILEDIVAVELKTSGRSRWFGCSRAYINSELRCVVVGHNKRDESRMRWQLVPVALQDGKP